MKTSLRFLLIVPVAAVAASCSSKPEVSIGEPVGASLTDYAASWDGYAEAYQFEDQSDRIRLVVDGSGMGTLQVGDSPALPPVTDPNVGYPTDATWWRSGWGWGLPATLLAGFGYPLHWTRVEDSRIRFGLWPYDLWAGWCALQQPFLHGVNDDGSSYYGCAPYWSMVYSNGECLLTNPDSQETTAIDCGKWTLCDMSGVCSCTASACTEYTVPDLPAEMAPVQVDAALSADGTELDGTLLIDGQRITIRMHR